MSKLMDSETLNFGPAAWNSLLPQPRTITDTNTFKQHLESFLFIHPKCSHSLLVLLDMLYSSAL